MRDFIGWVAFFIALGLIGTIERGGSLTLAWWTFPLLAVWCLCLARNADRND